MANDRHSYYSTPNAAPHKGTPAVGRVATTPSLSYPTSLRTSLYHNSPAIAAAYSSRVPLVAQLHAPTASSPRTSLTRVHARSASTTTTTGRRKPRTSNPFEDLSAPAFDSFIDNLTSTLRSVLEPPAPSTSVEERKRRESERQERERLREVARLEREQRKRGEEDVFGQVVAVVDAAGVVGQDGDKEKEDGKLSRRCVRFFSLSEDFLSRIRLF